MVLDYIQIFIVIVVVVILIVIILIVIAHLFQFHFVWQFLIKSNMMLLFLIPPPINSLFIFPINVSNYISTHPFLNAVVQYNNQNLTPIA